MTSLPVSTPFEVFMSQLIETNATLGYYSDFLKAAKNVESISMKLHQLNYLLGKDDLDAAVHRLWQENPSVFSVMNILIAVRRKEKKKAFDKEGNLRLITDFFHSPNDVIEFLEATGLKKVFQARQIKNLTDYVFGVEVGLDTNARKNRVGDAMEEKIAQLLNSYDIPYQREVYSTDFPELSCLGEDIKRFDFVIKADKTYLIEVNFYSSSGSKPNEVARSYSELAPKINALQDFEFVWITDGFGWRSSKNKLEEAFSVIPRLYNLTSIHNFLQKISPIITN